MPAKNVSRVIEKGAYSHVYNKGVENRVIFSDNEDYEVFIGYLKDYLSSPTQEKTKKDFTIKGRTFRGTPHQPKNYFDKVELLSYSLAPTHFHLILHQKAEKSVERFIRSLCTRYSMYFNKKYRRGGALFAGPYKSAQLETKQLLPLSMHIHNESSYSSLPDYLGQKENSWVNTKVIQSSFGQKGGSFQQFLKNHKFAKEDRELVANVIIEEEHNLLARRLPESDTVVNSSKQIHTKTPKWDFRFPEFAVLSGVFVMLFLLGVRNVQSQVSKEALVAHQETTVLPAATSIPSQKVTIKTGDTSAQINVRKSPTAESDKLGRARDGDSFEFVSENSGWYEIKFGESNGFVSSDFSILERSAN